jgi:hypothetical protein
MLLPNAGSCLAWSIANTKGCIIERKIRTNPRDCVKRRCGASNQRGRPNAFSQPLDPLLGISSHADTAYAKGEYRALLQSKFLECNEITAGKHIA